MRLSVESASFGYYKKQVASSFPRFQKAEA
jgi:hypothetical protein